MSGSSTLHGTPPQDKDKPEDDQGYEPVPDYPNDLNACHEAEKTMTGEEGDKFVEILYDIVARQITIYGAAFKRIHATAAQRCEAFLRTKGLWQDAVAPTRSDCGAL